MTEGTGWFRTREKTTSAKTSTSSFSVTMAPPRPPEEPGQPCPSENTQGQPPTTQTDPENPQLSKGKERKRVGFASDTQSTPGSTPRDTPRGTPSEARQEPRDYFSYLPGSDDEGSPVPRSSVDWEQFDKAELTAALTKILKPEHHGPSKPRPVLRKQTVLDSPSDSLAAPHRSEIEARHRADRLAYDVGSSSAPVSTRGSVDMSGVDLPHDQDTLLEKPEGSTTGTSMQDFARGGSAGLRPRKGSQQVASELVRTHTRRISPLTEPSLIPRSGTATPLEHDLEYVPRPEKYKGGILGNLLKLYNAEDNKSGAIGSESSAVTTPAHTPNRTPVGSPTTSRPGTPRLDKGRSRLRGLRSQSSTTLSNLMEGSFMFAAPGGTKDIADAVSEKLRQEKERPKKRTRSRQKMEEFRITVHIAEIISRHQYLLKLCRALMMYGAPTHRLETYMRMSARVLAIEGQFMYLPGTMIISFDDRNTHTTEVKIVRSPQGVDLGRLRDVHQIYKDVVHDRTGVEEATTRLNEVISRKNKYPTWLRVLLFGVASAFVAPFGFEGRYIDMPICFILGCLVGFLQLYLAPSNELYANVFEITAAVATSFLSRMFGSIKGGSLFCFSALAQSSIALILPGYIVLCASLELQSHQMVSGSVRMVYALIYSLFLGYGITIGSVIYGYMDEKAVSAVHCSIGAEWYTHRPDQNFYILFVLPFTLCLCAINQAKWRQTPGMSLPRTEDPLSVQNIH